MTLPFENYYEMGIKEERQSCNLPPTVTSQKLRSVICRLNGGNLIIYSCKAVCPVLYGLYSLNGTFVSNF